MFIGIDGSGPGDDGTYASEMRHSFVNVLVRQCPDKHKDYLRGPTLTGSEVATIARTVTQLIQRYVDAGDRVIALAGYSRGGAVAVVVAQNLKTLPWAHGLRINCLALFDAVDRDLRTGSETIPDNVRFAYHARRNTMIGSRVYFGNAGTKYSAATKYEEGFFVATHAALGGMPWTGDRPGDLLFSPARVEWKRGPDDIAQLATQHPHHPAVKARASSPAKVDLWRGNSGPDNREKIAITETQDNDGARQVRLWMWQRLQRHGVVPKGGAHSV